MVPKDKDTIEHAIEKRWSRGMTSSDVSRQLSDRVSSGLLGTRRVTRGKEVTLPRGKDTFFFCYLFFGESGEGICV